VVPVQVRSSFFGQIPGLAEFQGVPSGITLSELPPAGVDRTLADLVKSLSAGIV
jgi:hypothetical protein